MDKLEYDEQQAPDYYSRAQFKKDAAWMGLNAADRAISRDDLRQQRNHLLSQHHPDHGGAADMAVRINATYARMNGWLDRRRTRREKIRARRDDLERELRENRILFRPAAAVAKEIGAINLYALALMAALTYTALTKKRQ